MWQPICWAAHSIESPQVQFSAEPDKEVLANFIIQTKCEGLTSQRKPNNTTIYILFHSVSEKINWFSQNWLESTFNLQEGNQLSGRVFHMSLSDTARYINFEKVTVHSRLQRVFTRAHWEDFTADLLLGYTVIARAVRITWSHVIILLKIIPILKISSQN